MKHRADPFELFADPLPRTKTRCHDVRCPARDHCRRFLERHEPGARHTATFLSGVGGLDLFRYGCPHRIPVTGEKEAAA